ncbi:MAG: hypothetical protein HY299_18850 [Verrucomicrobia bacterium]|nr:hypothetical protein [Verrucomicrobiota bacterium]
MTNEQIQTAINKGVPFAIRMTDGECYEVNARHKIARGRTAVVVLGDNGMPRILPLLTMTGIS